MTVEKVVVSITSVSATTPVGASMKDLSKGSSKCLQSVYECSVIFEYWLIIGLKKHKVRLVIDFVAPSLMRLDHII